MYYKGKVKKLYWGKLKKTDGRWNNINNCYKVPYMKKSHNEQDSSWMELQKEN